MEKALGMITDTKIEKTVTTKVQAAFTQEVELYQLKTITIDIMEDDEYVKKIETRLLTNKHARRSLNIAVTRYV